MKTVASATCASRAISATLALGLFLIVYLGGALLGIGIGFGATVAPSMAAAFRALSRAETPRATSALNVIQLTAGAIGTALFAIILQHEIAARTCGPTATWPTPR